jgi:hypothetical protein
MNWRKAFLAVLVAGMLVTQAAGSVAAADALNYEADMAPDPYLEADVTVATHDRADMSGPLQFYDDNGALETLPASLNSSMDAPLRVRYDQIDDEDLREFPRVTGEENNSVSAIQDVGDWTTSSATVSDADGTTADGVPAIQVSTSGLADGNTGTATYSNFSVESDANKRVLQVVMNVDQLDSGAEVAVRAVDSDGDYRQAVVNASRDASADGVIGNSTGQGYVFQERLADLALQGSGDGAFDGVQEVKIVTSDADAQVTVVALDVERKSEWTLGEAMMDEEVQAVSERYAGGDMTLHMADLSTLPSALEDARIKELGVMGVQFRGSDLSMDDQQVQFGDADAYSYPKKVEAHWRLEIPAAIDLSYSNLALQHQQEFVGERYATFRVAEGVGDKEFGNISSDSYSDVTGSLTAQGSVHTLDDTVQTGQSYVVNAVILLQRGEAGTLKTSADAGGGGGFWSGTGNPLAVAMNWVAAALAGLAGLFGLGKARAARNSGGS